MVRYLLGVDWADQEHQVCVLDEQGQQVLQKVLANTAEELGEFGRWLYERRAEGISLHAAIEKPEGRIVDFLLDHGVEVYPINPKTLDRVRDRYRASKSKSDAFDAFVLADYLRTDQHRLSALKPNSDQAAELKMLTRDYHKLVGQQTRLINQLKATLKEYYPCPLEVFEDLAAPTCLDFLRAYPTPQDLETLSRAKWQKFGKARRMGPDQIQKTFELLKAPQLAVPDHVVRSKSKLMLVLTEQLSVTAKAVSEYRGEVERFFTRLPAAKLAVSLPAGKTGVIVPTIFAEMGDAPGRWASFRHLQAEAGSTPYTKQSGKSRTVHFRFSCNKRLRYATYWLAFRSLTQSEWAKAYYQRQRDRGHTHHQALRALGAKWLKIIFVMWRDQVPYSEDRHLANLYRQQPKQSVSA